MSEIHDMLASLNARAAGKTPLARLEALEKRVAALEAKSAAVATKTTAKAASTKTPARDAEG